ncbi:MAG TPA: nucleoside-diphosphate kinase [Thermoprotei archaeon]|nr:nucleoside-diphosphate kinase [Thermoprotei archaeon]
MEKDVERTFVMIKPDGVKRGLIGEVIRRLEQKGLKIVAMKMTILSKERAERQYEVHKGKPFYEDLIKYITSGPVVLMVVEGPSAVEVVRALVGSTDGRKATPGTIRGDFSLDIRKNIVHAADSKESAIREISIHFKEDEIINYKRVDEEIIFPD